MSDGERVVLGVGLEPGTPVTHVLDLLATLEAPLRRPDVVATVDTRAQEPAIAALAAGRRLHTYPTTALAAVDVPNPSPTVRRLTGTGSVAEAAALLAARELDPDAVLVVEKQRGEGVTVAVALARTSGRT